MGVVPSANTRSIGIHDPRRRGYVEFESPEYVLRGRVGRPWDGADRCRSPDLNASESVPREIGERLNRHDFALAWKQMRSTEPVVSIEKSNAQLRT